MFRCTVLRSVVKRIDKNNFESRRKDVLKLVQSASFISFDCEFTGVPQRGTDFADLTSTPDEYGAQLRKVTADTALLQFGFSIFSHSENSYHTTTFSLDVIPNDYFYCNRDALEMLTKEGGCNLEHLLNHGVGSGEVTQLVGDLIGVDVPLVGFQCLYDVFLMASYFFGNELQGCSLTDYLWELGRHIHSIIDLRYLAVQSGYCRTGAGLYKYYKGACKVLKLDPVDRSKTHEAGMDAYMTGICYEAFHRGGVDVASQNVLLVYGYPFVLRIPSGRENVFEMLENFLFVGTTTPDGRRILEACAANMRNTDFQWVEYGRLCILTFLSTDDQEIMECYLREFDFKIVLDQHSYLAINRRARAEAETNSKKHKQADRARMHEGKSATIDGVLPTKTKKTKKLKKKKKKKNKLLLRRKLRAFCKHVSDAKKENDDKTATLEKQIGMMAQGLKNYQAKNLLLRETVNQLSKPSVPAPSAERPDSVGPNLTKQPVRRKILHKALQSSATIKSERRADSLPLAAPRSAPRTQPSSTGAAPSSDTPSSSGATPSTGAAPSSGTPSSSGATPSTSATPSTGAAPSSGTPSSSGTTPSTGATSSTGTPSSSGATPSSGTTPSDLPTPSLQKAVSDQSADTSDMRDHLEANLPQPPVSNPVRSEPDEKGAQIEGEQSSHPPDEASKQTDTDLAELHIEPPLSEAAVLAPPSDGEEKIVSNITANDVLPTQSSNLEPPAENIPVQPTSNASEKGTDMLKLQRPQATVSDVVSTPHSSPLSKPNLKPAEPAKKATPHAAEKYLLNKRSAKKREEKAAPRPMNTERQVAPTQKTSLKQKTPPVIQAGKLEGRVLADIESKRWTVLDYKGPLCIVLLPDPEESWKIEVKNCSNITIITPMLGASSLFQDCTKVRLETTHTEAIKLFWKRHAMIGGCPPTVGVTDPEFFGDMVTEQCEGKRTTCAWIERTSPSTAKLRTGPPTDLPDELIEKCLPLEGFHPGGLNKPVSRF